MQEFRLSPALPIAVSVTLASLLLSACSIPTGAPTASNETEQKCDNALRLTDKIPTYAVVATAGSKALVTGHQDTLETVLQAGVTSKARVLVNGVADGLDAPNLLANAVMVPKGNNDTERKTNLACKKQLVRNAFAALATRPKAAKLDVISALRLLEQDFVGAPPNAERDVVLVGSLMNEVAPVDLTRTQTIDDPTSAINELAKSSGMPRCTGWRVDVVGGGFAREKPLSDALNVKLKEFWRQFFARCGGALVTWNTRLDTFPDSSGPLPGPDRRLIRVEQKSGAVVVTLKGDVFFDVNSATLRPDAEPSLLNQLLPLTVGATLIFVAGYSDNTGNDAVNMPLSKGRARTVAQLLVAHGVDGQLIRYDGYGSANPVESNATPEGRAANRRVTVTVYKKRRSNGGGEQLTLRLLEPADDTYLGSSGRRAERGQAQPLRSQPLPHLDAHVV